MFIKTSRASAWVDRPGNQEASSPAASAATIKTSQAAAMPRFARRAFEAPLGRCVALRVQVSSGRPDRLLVLLVPRYATSSEPRWMPLEEVLTDAQARRWMETGF